MTKKNKVSAASARFTDAVWIFLRNIIHLNEALFYKNTNLVKIHF
jgi:hypothetical protein